MRLSGRCTKQANTEARAKTASSPEVGKTVNRSVNSFAFCKSQSLYKVTTKRSFLLLIQFASFLHEMRLIEISKMPFDTLLNLAPSSFQSIRVPSFDKEDLIT